MAAHDDLAHLDATAQAELVRAGERHRSSSSTPRSRASRSSTPSSTPSSTRCSTRRAPPRHSRSARTRPFPGVPMVLKDLDGPSAGEPYHARQPRPEGRRVRRRPRQLPLRDASSGRVHRRSASRTRPSSGCCRPPSPRRTARPATRGTPTRSPGGSSGGSARRSRRGMVPSATRATAAAPSASRPACADSSGSSRRAAASRSVPTTARTGAARRPPRRHPIGA